MRTSSSRNRLPLIAACVAVIAAVTAPSQAAPAGSFDNSFSGDGRVKTSMPGNSYGQDMALMNNGKILIVGFRQTGVTVLLRFRPNGAPDMSFGNEGRVTIPIPENSERRRVIARGDNIFVGATTYEGFDGNWVFAKVNAAGEVDDSYGTSGLLTVDEGFDERMRDLAPGADGKFYGVGQSHTGQGQYMIARFNSDGTLDTDSDDDPSTDWADDGVFRTDSEGNPSPLGVHELGDGNVLVGAAGNNYEHVMVRFTPDGEIDTSFHDGGIATFDPGPNIDHIERLGFGGGAMYVASNVSENDIRSFRVSRITYDGEPDLGFDDDGRTNVDIAGEEFSNHVVVDALGRPIIALYRYRASTETADWVIVRLTTDGSRDETFGTNGVAPSTGLSAASEGPSALAIQADGRILAGGSVAPAPEKGRIAIARYLSGTCGTIGSPLPDLIQGSPAADYICGLGDNDELIGEGGNDRLAGGNGDDILNGGPGTDVCIGGKGTDQYIDCEVER